MLLDPSDVCTIDHWNPGSVDCETTVPQVTPASPWLQHSGGIYETAQTSPISITFAEPVLGIALSSSGALKCSGASIGSVVGYRSGLQVDSLPNSLADSTDCGWDDVTYGVVGGLDPNTVVDSVVVHGVDPWQFSVNGVCCGRALLNYTVEFLVAPRISVSCMPATITRASSIPVSCTASASDGSLAITEWRFTATDSGPGSVTSSQTSATWQGMAVASGGVTVQGTVDGVTAVSDTGHISVTARGWSWSADKSTGDATAGTFECNTNPHYATSIFGWTHADSSCMNVGLMLWPDPFGASSQRSWTVAQVPAGGPNAGLWYVTSDSTGMHVRAQVLKDIRPDGFTYPVGGSDTVGTSCNAASVSGSQTITVVNNTCMNDPSSFNFAALYAFAWRHERCHLLQDLNVFPTIPDPRTALEELVRSDTTSLSLAVTSKFFVANEAILDANTIDVPNPQSYTLWSRNASNTAWFLRTYPPNGILAQGC